MLETGPDPRLLRKLGRLWRRRRNDAAPVLRQRGRRPHHLGRRSRRDLEGAFVLGLGQPDVLRLRLRERLPEPRFDRSGVRGILPHSVEQPGAVEADVPSRFHGVDQRPLDGAEGRVGPVPGHRFVDRVRHHLAGNARFRAIAIPARPRGDGIGGDLLLVPVERDAVDRLRRRATPHRPVRGESHLGDPPGVGAVEHSFGDHVQESARVLRLVRIDDVEGVVGELLLERCLDGLPRGRVQGPVLEQPRVHVLEDVLPPRCVQRGREEDG